MERKKVLHLKEKYNDENPFFDIHGDQYRRL